MLNFATITKILIILGRLFLATAQALKEYENVTIMFRVNGEKFFVKTVNSKKIFEPEGSDSVEECWTIKKLIAEAGIKLITKDKMELALNIPEESLDQCLQLLCQHLDSSKGESRPEVEVEQQIIKTVNQAELDESGVMPLMDSQIENLITIENSNPTVEEELKLEPMIEIELKPLPKNLKYEFLDDEQKFCPVIISSELTKEQEDKLLEILKRNKKALGWTISDLKGISPLICSHHIYLENDVKPSREMQRRLNLNLRDVVKAEICKWLSAGFIYPISDSKWVSPLHVVPKKSGLKVVKNVKGE